MFSTALCSPPRAALLTGRNHHSSGFGVISEQSTGFPGYNSIIARDKATIGRVIQAFEDLGWLENTLILDLNKDFTQSENIAAKFPGKGSGTEGDASRSSCGTCST